VKGAGWASEIFVPARWVMRRGVFDEEADQGSARTEGPEQPLTPSCTSPGESCGCEANCQCSNCKCKQCPSKRGCCA
jgi:hypothetical protein